MALISWVQLAVAIVGIAAVSALLILKFKKKLTTLIAFFCSFMILLLASFTILILGFFKEPEFKVLGESSIVVPVYAEFVDPGAEAKFGYKNYNNKIDISSDVNTTELGEYSINYDFHFRGRHYSATRQVIVSDNIAPELSLLGSEKLTLSAYDFYKEPGFEATDNYDGDITDKVKVTTQQISKDFYKITYTVADSSGNTTSLTRELEIKDIVKPKFKSSGEVLNIALGSKLRDLGVKAYDDLDGDITSKIKMSGSVNTAEIGTYPLTFTVSDKSGNKASLKMQVNVYKPNNTFPNQIYLTFDDGPSAVTGKVLDVLKKNNIKATFFIIDYTEKELPIVKRIISEGHKIGIHGYSHDYADIYKSEKAFLNNVYKLRDKLKKDTGYITNIMRFPGGSSNQVSVRYCKDVVSAAAKTLLEKGWQYYDWNIDSSDANAITMPSSSIISSVKEGLRKNRHNVVLMHDSDSKITTAQSLQQIIDYAHSHGFVFNSINQTTPKTHHTIAN